MNNILFKNTVYIDMTGINHFTNIIDTIYLNGCFNTHLNESIVKSEKYLDSSYHFEKIIDNIYLNSSYIDPNKVLIDDLASDYIRVRDHNNIFSSICTNSTKTDLFKIFIFCFKKNFFLSKINCLLEIFIFPRNFPQNGEDIKNIMHAIDIAANSSNWLFRDEYNRAYNYSPTEFNFTRRRRTVLHFRNSFKENIINLI